MTGTVARTTRHGAGAKSSGAPFVRVPAAFFDEHLPRLSGAEAKVFLVVCRQTLGRREPGVPGGAAVVHRRRDWLSHALLVNRTGCGSEAVSSAVRRLVDRGLIAVEAADGTPLPTADARRRHLGRLYYRLDGLGEPGKDPGKGCGNVENSPAEPGRGGRERR